MDTIKAYIDFNDNVDGIDFRKSVFLFLRFGFANYFKILFLFFIYSLFQNNFSNSGSRDILKLTMELNSQNIDRKNFDPDLFFTVLENSTYFSKSKLYINCCILYFKKNVYSNSFHVSDKEKKGMASATIIEHRLIDHYIPFLPLEREHVKKCIQTEMHRYKMDVIVKKPTLEKDIEQIAGSMKDEPDGFFIYSSAGCKRVSNLVRNLIAERGYTREEL